MSWRSRVEPSLRACTEGWGAALNLAGFLCRYCHPIPHGFLAGTTFAPVCTEVESGSVRRSRTMLGANVVQKNAHISIHSLEPPLCCYHGEASIVVQRLCWNRKITAVVGWVNPGRAWRPSFLWLAHGWGMKVVAVYLGLPSRLGLAR